MPFFSGTISALLAVCGFAAIPYVYMFSYKKTVSGGFTFFMLSSLVIGAFGSVALVAMEMSDDYKDLVGRLRPAAMLVPPFSLTYNGVAFARKAVANYNWGAMDEAYRLAVCRTDPNPCCGKSWARCGGQDALNNVAPERVVGNCVRLQHQQPKLLQITLVLQLCILQHKLEK